MALFQKVAQGATKLFNKYSQDPKLFRKISNSARDVDKVVQKVGNFLTPLSMLNPSAATGLQSVMGGSSVVRNALEKGYKNTLK
jgi:hypothetical protein